MLAAVVNLIGGMEKIACDQTVKSFFLFSGNIRAAGKSSPHPFCKGKLNKRIEI